MNELALDNKIAAVYQVSELMAHYAKRLDACDLTGWAELFAPDARYFVASMENVKAGNSLLLMNDDTKSKIEDRVRFVEQFWEGSYNDYLSRHVLSLPLLLDVRDDCVDFEQSFALYMTENDVSSDQMGTSQVLCVGSYRGSVRVGAEQTMLIELGAYLDTSSLSRSLVYPV